MAHKRLSADSAGKVSFRISSWRKAPDGERVSCVSGFAAHGTYAEGTPQNGPLCLRSCGMRGRIEDAPQDAPPHKIPSGILREAGAMCILVRVCGAAPKKRREMSCCAIFFPEDWRDCAALSELRQAGCTEEAPQDASPRKILSGIRCGTAPAEPFAGCKRLLFGGLRACVPQSVRAARCRYGVRRVLPFRDHPAFIRYAVGSAGSRVRMAAHRTQARDCRYCGSSSFFASGTFRGSAV